MNNRFFPVLLIILACSLLLTACSPTTLTGKWQAEGNSKVFSRFLVLGFTNNKAATKIFETRLSVALKEQGVSAYPGHAVFSYEETLEKASIVDYVKKNKIDSVLITKVLDSQTYTQRVTDVSGGYQDHFSAISSRRGGGWYGDYSYGDTATTYETEFNVFNLETSLYAADGEKLVWVAFTETETLDRAPDGINDLVELLVMQLKQDGLI